MNVTRYATHNRIRTPASDAADAALGIRYATPTPGTPFRSVVDQARERFLEDHGLTHCDCCGIAFSTEVYGIPMGRRDNGRGWMTARCEPCFELPRAAPRAMPGPAQEASA